MASGGSRRGAGRKSNGEILKLRALMDRYITAKQWGALIVKAHDEALEGGKLGAARHAWLFLNRYGSATQMIIEDEPAVGPIQFISVPADAKGDVPNVTTAGQPGRRAETAHAPRTGTGVEQSKQVRRRHRWHTKR